MMKEKRNQLKQSTIDNKPLLFRAHSMFCLSALFNSRTCRVEAACTSLPDDFFLSPSVCSHVNVAVVYDVDVVSSVPCNVRNGKSGNIAVVATRQRGRYGYRARKSRFGIWHRLFRRIFPRAAESGPRFD